MMNIAIYKPEQQGTGEFDGGSITEQKPIGFPRENSAVKRVGPLFYWAWAFSKGEGAIGSHPHQAFEIMTYVVQGKAEHGDSLGTRSVVGPGGAQVMQTGSGVSHEERFIGPDMEAFQIWFEPDLKQSVKQAPTYNQFEDEAFPVIMQSDARVKTVIGEGSPVQLTTDAKMWDVAVKPGAAYTHIVPAGYQVAALAIRGDGNWSDSAGQSTRFERKDFTVIETDAEQQVSLHAEGSEELRMIVIQVPAQVSYSLYRK